MAAELVRSGVYFEIRGHHLTRFRQILKFYDECGEVPVAIERLIILVKSGIVGHNDLEYKLDYLGATQEEESRHWQGYRELLKNFLIAPDSCKVRIIKDKKDDICRLCAVGNHCVTLAEQVFNGDEFEVQYYLGSDYLRDINIKGHFEINLGILKKILRGSI